MTRVIDAVSNIFTRNVAATRPGWSASHMHKRFSINEQRTRGIPLSQQLDEMDRAGIDSAILIVQMMGAPGTPGHWAMDHRPVVDAMSAYPDRFHGQAGIDPTAGRSGLDSLRRLADEHGFVGAHFYPHWFDMPPDAAAVFPYYELCAELGIPIQIQVGQSMVYSPERPLRSVGDPMSLEPVAMAFPELSVVGSHLGFPWMDEMIAMASLYPNIFVCTDSYAPKHWSANFNEFVANGGVGKVMFGTMWPTIDYARAISEIKAKHLPPAALEQLLGGAAAAVYKLT